MRKNINKFKAILLILVSLFSATGFFGIKFGGVQADKSSAYYYELDSSYLQALASDTETLDSTYNLANLYPLVNENQTDSGFCWMYTSLKSLETALMIQRNEYYNFSEVGMAYLNYAYKLENGQSATFNAGGNFESFVNCYQDVGFVFESDFSNTEYESMNLSSDRLEYYSYVKNYATKELNSIIKPYQISNLSYFSSLTTSAKRNVVKRFVKRYGSVFCGIEGGSSVGCFYSDNSAQDISDGIYTFYDYDRTRHQDVSSYRPLTENHAVSIIGWNDDVRFGSEKGAFIVMNSWGFESNSLSFFYIPYSYINCYSTFKGFICDDSAQTDISVESAQHSSFTTNILTGSNELKNFFCYDDEIAITYKLNLLSLENMKVKVTSGKTDFSDRFNIVFNNTNKTIFVELQKGSEFYGGNYTISFYNDGTLVGKRELFVYSATEIGNFRVNTETKLDSYALNNAFLNKDDIATINLSGPVDYYFLSFNLANICNYSTIMLSEKSANWKDLNFEINEISIVSSNASHEALNYSNEELKMLFYKNTNSVQGNRFVIQIGYGLTLSKFKNTLVKFKIKIDSVLYDCSREYTINMFVSDDVNAKTSDLYSINYVLNDGENDSRNITKYPNFWRTITNVHGEPETVSTDMTEVQLYAPTKIGANFMGWYLTEDFSDEPITKFDKTLTGNITLYARWDEIATDYFGIDLSLVAVSDYEGVSKSLSDTIIYGDSIVIRLNFTEKTALNGYSYSVNYFFNGTSLVDGYLTGNYQDFNLNFPDLKSGNQTFRIKVIVAIAKNLSVTKEATIGVSIAKKHVGFSFEDLNKVYDGTVQKPTVVMTEDFYSEDKLGKTQDELFVLKCDQITKNVGSYNYYISELLNNNYEFDENSAKCTFEIEKRGILLSWKNYNHTYDGRNHFPEYEVLGIVDGDNVSFAFTIDECINAGSYTINIKPETISNSNYQVGAVEDFTFEIKKAEIRIIMHNATDRVQTKTAKRIVPTFTVIGNYYSVEDLDLNVISEGRVSQNSGTYSITCEVRNRNYSATVQKATYTLTGYYYVYYQLSNGNTYAERVEEGQSPTGVTKKDLNAPVFSKITYSEDYVVNGDDIYVLVTLKDYSATAYSLIFVGVFAIVCLIVYLKKRESKVR